MECSTVIHQFIYENAQFILSLAIHLFLEKAGLGGIAGKLGGLFDK